MVCPAGPQIILRMGFSRFIFRSPRTAVLFAATALIIVLNVLAFSQAGTGSPAAGTPPSAVDDLIPPFVARLSSVVTSVGVVAVVVWWVFWGRNNEQLKENFTLLQQENALLEKKIARLELRIADLEKYAEDLRKANLRLQGLKDEDE